MFFEFWAELITLFFFFNGTPFLLGHLADISKKKKNYEHVTLKTINGKVTSDQNFSFHVKIWLSENFHLPLWDWQIFLYLKTFYE